MSSIIFSISFSSSICSIEDSNKERVSHRYTFAQEYFRSVRCVAAFCLSKYIYWYFSVISDNRLFKDEINSFIEQAIYVVWMSSKNIIIAYLLVVTNPAALVILTC